MEFKLLKDLPYSKKGAIYTREINDHDYYNTNGGEYRNRISKDYVENNDEWFAYIGNGCVIRTERGWAGHFISSNSCRFRRNTLLTYGKLKIVISSVGQMEINGEFETIGHNRYFETMAFHSDKKDKRYFDADFNKQISFDSDWLISEIDADDKANEMHEAVVAEITEKLIKGHNLI